VIDSLQQDGLSVDFVDVPDDGPDAVLEVNVDGAIRRLAIDERRRAPYPGELATLFERRDQIGLWGTPTLVAPFVPETVARLLIPMGWSWADEEGNYDLALGRGMRFKQRVSASPQRRTLKRTLPQGAGGLAIIRFLISAPKELQRTGELAARFGITHARASQVLNKLREAHLAMNDGGRWIADRDALLQRFLEEYRGPGGSELALYSLDPPQEALETLLWDLRSGSRADLGVALSADVASDLVAPWRHPTVAVLYVSNTSRLSLSPFVQADRASANLVVRYPADSSVFGAKPVIASLRGKPVRLADPTQLIWDLYDLGGEERREAAAHLSEWLLKAA
jgi:hypothetical protein